MYFEKYWKRFLDDCFILWTKSLTELNTFHDILNNLHVDIKFTIEFSSEKQPFLDVLVKQVEGNIETDIYYKDRDSKQYFVFSSCHPRHTKTSIPFWLACRIKTIVSSNSTLQKRIAELKLFLQKQKYPINIINLGIEKAMLLNRDILLQVKPKSTENIIPFVSTYNPKNPEMFNIIKNNLPILQQDECMKQIFSRFSFIKSKRQPKKSEKASNKSKI